ncbi:type VI immunity family protein [Sorangium atrum]|uniref:DUF3396 domain-containing protein n=1 Tax=Sorangium atrum TaxID=2995308 RepID=A0ABT5BRC3_9BACT|nr:type VI immunity family protein [Sorangium aterium]MDC0676711.1 DUF3396 domain-containing protein [Sorangium aterium]
MANRPARSSATIDWPKSVEPTEPAFLNLRFAAVADGISRPEVESSVLHLLDELSRHGGQSGGASFLWSSGHDVECSVEGLVLPPKASTWLRTRLQSQWRKALVELRLHQELAPVRANQPSRGVAAEEHAAGATEASALGAFEPLTLRHPDTHEVLVLPCIEIMVVAAGENATVRSAVREFGARWLARFPDTALLSKGGDHKAYRVSSVAQAQASWCSHFDAKNRRVGGVHSLAAGGNVRSPEPPTLVGELMPEGAAARGCLPIAWASRPSELATLVDELCGGLELTSGWCGISQYVGPDGDAQRWLEDQWGPLRERGLPSHASWIRDFPGITVGEPFVYSIWGNQPYLLHVGWITLLGRDFARRMNQELASLASAVEMASLPGGVVRIRTGDAPNAGGTIDDGRELRVRERVGRALRSLRLPDDDLEHFGVRALSERENRAYYLRFFGA